MNKTIVNLEEFFLKLSENFLEAQGAFESPTARGIFSSAIIVWLCIQQRIKNCTLQDALISVIESKGEIVTKNAISKKVRNREVSNNNGGIARARKRLPIGFCEKLYEEVYKNLSPSKGSYIIDGSVLTVARTAESRGKYGLHGTGRGNLHFPRVRVVTAHCAQTGVATLPAIGTLKDSEPALAKKVLEKLPKGSTVILDRVYASPKLIEYATNIGLKVVVRLSTQIANKLLKGKQKNDITPVTWQMHRNTSVEVKGDVINYSCSRDGFRSQEFFLFSTTRLQVQEVASLYKQRWDVETFIRQLKQTLKLEFIRSREPEIIEKEIIIAYLTFNLLRSIMATVAKKINIAPRLISLTATISVCNAFAPSFLNSSTDRHDAIVNRLLTALVQTKLPDRKKTRNYPRVIKRSKALKYSQAPLDASEY